VFVQWPAPRLDCTSAKREPISAEVKVSLLLHLLLGHTRVRNRCCCHCCCCRCCCCWGSSKLPV
jgi:hypothetical protein